MHPNAKRWVFACERCNEIALLTLEMASRVSETSPVAGRFDCQPALCPQCSGTVVDTTPEVVQPLLEFDDPLTDRSNVVLIDPFTLRQAQKRIARCEHCFDDAEITFDYILDAVTGCDPSVTHYILCTPAKCPHCLQQVTEKTLVVPD
jgi:hypothetical protein